MVSEEVILSEELTDFIIRHQPAEEAEPILIFHLFSERMFFRLSVEPEHEAEEGEFVRAKIFHIP